MSNTATKIELSADDIRRAAKARQHAAAKAKALSNPVAIKTSKTIESVVMEIAGKVVDKYDARSFVADKARADRRINEVYRRSIATHQVAIAVISEYETVHTATGSHRARKEAAITSVCRKMAANQKVLDRGIQLAASALDHANTVAEHTRTWEGRLVRRDAHRAFSAICALDPSRLTPDLIAKFNA